MDKDYVKEKDQIIRLPRYDIHEIGNMAILGQNMDWGIIAHGLDKLHKLGYNGQGVKVCVVDTGANFSHPDLTFRETRNFTSDNSVVDQLGHGSFVAGQIAAKNNEIGFVGGAYGAELYACKVLANNGFGYDTWVATGIRHAWEAWGCEFINCSLGGNFSQKIANAVEYVTGQGAVVIASIGNSGSEGTSHPGNDPKSIGVAAVNEGLVVASFSSVGQVGEADISAAGVNIYSTYKGKLYTRMSGTSMAAPYVTSCLAVLKSAGIKVTHEILYRHAVDIGDPGYDVSSGHGFLDAYKIYIAEKEATEPPNPPTPCQEHMTGDDITELNKAKSIIDNIYAKYSKNG